ncbi:hypothetical protein As57867_001146, partial [Aphanomyces stellatus]
MKLVSTGLSILALAGHALAGCSAITANTDFVDNDIASVPATSAADCCAPCQANPDCTVFSYANGVCYLKSGSPARVAKNGVSTGSKAIATGSCSAITPDTDYQDNDLASVTAASAAACCAPCQNTATCTTFAFSDGVCYLKFGSPKRIPKAGVSTGAIDAGRTCGAITDGTDYKGNDLTSVAGKTAADCCAPCQANDQCTVFAFANGACYLKYGSPQRISMP